MGVRILHDEGATQACLYCSTSDWAFGPVFSDTGTHGADERAEAFCRWLDSPECPYQTFEAEPFPIADHRRDPRTLTKHGLESAYSAWLAQESEQIASEQAAEQKESVE